MKACYDFHMQEAHKPIDRWLGLMSAAIGVILFLIPKTPSIIVVVCLVLIFLLLIHPVWNLWWVEKCLIIIACGKPALSISARTKTYA